MLQPVIAQEQAVSNMTQHLRNWIARWMNKGKQLQSVELVYLPYVIYPYELETKSIGEKINGFVGIETYDKHAVILPINQKTEKWNSSLPALPAGEAADSELAYEAVYKEAFLKEKRRQSIRLQIGDPFLLYVPYWIGYLTGREKDILVVDGLSGNIDIKLKDPVIEAFLKEAEQLHA